MSEESSYYLGMVGPALWTNDHNRVLRPRDFRDRYRNPPREFARMARTGELLALAHGYHLAVPEESRGGAWRPAIEGVALGVGVADYGRASVALMGPSAARLLGAIPRALAAATVAVPRQRPTLVTAAGTIHFVRRTIERLDTQRVVTDITDGWVTTPEQTVLDLADRPTLGGITVETAQEAIRAQSLRCDHGLVAALARRQHKLAAWQRYSWVVGDPVEPVHHGVPALGFRSTANATDYGVEPG